MRKLFLVLFLGFGLATYSQEYSFDSFYEYKSNKNNVIFFFVNSLDSNYFFYGYSNSDGITGYIHDLKKNESHHYNLTNLNDIVTFDYIDSRKYSSYYPFAFNKKIKYEYSSIEIDSSTNKLKIEKFKQSKKRKNLGFYELQYQKNDYIFHDSVLKFYSHGFFDNRDLEFTNNRLPTSITFNRYDNYYGKLTLTKKGKINTTLKINKINYKQ
ncbi:hypothetical protein ACSVH2_07930 [Flavobacterium sp. RSB2_4_14]|uniref:hypothetical protein n=1 Tax=Flavobacterium sp. RSB2_4_14 TaxID=3447665 RepID=UPI003F2F32F7